jgi:hypothetical protein
MLQTEFWVSFVSLLRSYAAAANLNRHQHAHIDEATHSATIVAGQPSLAMHFDPETGKVKWQKHNASHDPTIGTFEFQAEGNIAIAGINKDLDHVAIDIIDLASKPSLASNSGLASNPGHASNPAFVSGHDFSRAVNDPNNDGALAPEALKGHGFSRAEGSKESGALAPEGSSPQTGREKP